MKRLTSLVASCAAAGLIGLGLSGCDRRDGVPAVSPPATRNTVVAAPADVGSRTAWFGDLHVHSSWSVDGYIFGNTNDPRDAYRFARGAAVPIAGGPQMRQLEVPLDFAAVTDHAETLGYFNLCVGAATSAVYNTELCRQVRALDLSVFFSGFNLLSQNPPQHQPGICASNMACREAAIQPWQQLQAIAEEFNDPGQFTTFNAYEYTGNLDSGGMLHRNVIFANTSVPGEALSAFDLYTARELWEWLDTACSGDCDVITIPHNSNLAWGKTFALQNVDGSEWTAGDQERRARFDRLVEIHQAKGNSECRTGIGTTDEFCDFENLMQPCTEAGQTGCMRETSFVRNGLKMGLQLHEQLGLNPYQYGIIGSTDTHNGTPGDTSEVGYLGHQSVESTLEKRLTGGHRRGEGRGAVNYNPGGLAGAWAEENTRASLFAAFRRRETFGTSGNRVRVRLFAGWQYAANLHLQPDAVAQAYRQGVPMGATLRGGADAGVAPALFAWAAQDPAAAPLQRLQIIKGWTDASGSSFEQTYDVACAGGALPDPSSHRCPDNGASVDVADCSLQGAGAGQLAALWRDPAFDPGQHAFYYVRVLENPSCRWSSYDLLASEGRIEPSSPVPRVIQERAWSSPVWYAPD